MFLFECWVVCFYPGVPVSTEVEIVWSFRIYVATGIYLLDYIAHRTPSISSAIKEK